MEDSIYFSLNDESKSDDEQTAKIADIERENAKIKKKLAEASNSFNVFLGLKNGKIRELESELARVKLTDYHAMQDITESNEVPSLYILIALQMKTLITERTNNPVFATSPHNELMFTRLGDSTRPIGIIAIRNPSERTIRAKSNEKFFIFPSCGTLQSEAMEVVVVIANLKNEDPSIVNGENIELRALQNDSKNFDGFRQLWRETLVESKAKHELICRMDGNGRDQNNEFGVNQTNEHSRRLNENADEIEQQKSRILDLEAELVSYKAEVDENMATIRILQEQNVEGTKTIDEQERKMANMKRILEKYGHFSDF